MTKKEIIDNEVDGYRFFQFLNQEFNKKPEKADIASGFFNIGGYQLVRESINKMILDQNHRFRLLFGQESMAGIEPNNLDYKETMAADLDDMTLEGNKKNSVDDLIEFLKKENVHIRKSTERFSHAKCYIFGQDNAIVGSSNFTAAGLAGNIELNAVTYQLSAIKEIQSWFDRRWANSEDAKEELVQLIEESKFGMPLDPHTLYMKMLYEYYRQRLDDMEKSKDTEIELTEFQQDAVADARRILRKYGGVIISDSTGLGKTHIGIDLLRSLQNERRKKILLIAPAQVKETVWEPRLYEESIKTKNLSIEETGQPTFKITQKYLDADIVLIDESHNYRSSSAQRRENIMKILAGGKRKQVILMTATPINNTIMDLYYQLSLITAGDDSYFANLDIPHLREHFRRAVKKDLKEGLDIIVRLLDEIMIKRTRSFIRENYPEATLNGNPLKFPKRKLHKVRYSLTKLFGGKVYEKVVETIENLHMVPYMTDTYDRKKDREEQEQARMISVMQKILLMKRFESSVNAIRESIMRLEKFYEYFDKALDQNQIIKSDQFRQIIVEMHNDEEYDEEEFSKRLQEGKLELEQIGDAYDKKQMKADIKEDLEMITKLRKELEKIKPYGDTKLTALKEDLARNDVLEKEGKKAIIFTSYVDTAKYVYEDLSKELEGKKVLLLTGSVSGKKREEYLRQFSPESNYIGEDKPENIIEADVLVCTEVLSEGQNLQDCNYVVNYDLPWNPMRIVQRVGRVDRLTSRHAEVTSAVFVPENQLEELLGILEKLVSKIRTAGVTVGVEDSILGEDAISKTFNAMSRIDKEDSTLLDDMEKSSDLLIMNTPFQEILKYMHNIGLNSLRAIKLGRRSGLKSAKSGAVLMYRDKQTSDTHTVYYDHKSTKIEGTNDVTRDFGLIACKQEEPLSMPLKGAESFNYIAMVNTKATDEILQAVNRGHTSSMGGDVGGRFQKMVLDRIKKGFDDGVLELDDGSEAFKILSLKSMVPWEAELGALVDANNRDGDVSALLGGVQDIIARYKITRQEAGAIRKVTPDDLELVGCMFLDGPDMKDMKLLSQE